WFGRLSSTTTARRAMDVDYDMYAEGEALLGWLNATYGVSSANPFDGNLFLRQLADNVRRQLEHADVEIAHFKMTLAPDTGRDLAVLNLVGTDSPPESPHRLVEDLTGGELILNLRAEGDPDRLKATVNEGMDLVAQELGLVAALVHVEHFKPGRPVPTH